MTVAIINDAVDESVRSRHRELLAAAYRELDREPPDGRDGHALIAGIIVEWSDANIHNRHVTPIHPIGPGRTP